VKYCILGKFTQTREKSAIIASSDRQEMEDFVRSVKQRKELEGNSDLKQAKNSSKIHTGYRFQYR